MKERPILFSGAMVNAILSGAKTQTRRMRGLEFENESPNDWAVIRRMEKVEPSIDGEPCDFPGADDNSWLALKDEHGVADYGFNCLPCPYGKVGDRLWVRESFCHFGNRYSHGESFGLVKYLADGATADLKSDSLPDHGSTHSYWRKNRPSIHMPRWASRITLEITGARVERLLNLSNADALAEGILPKQGNCGFSWDEGNPTETPDCECCDRPVERFAELWDKINGKKHSWASNPFVWVIEFKRLEQK